VLHGTTYTASFDRGYAAPAGNLKLQYIVAGRPAESARELLRAWRWEERGRASLNCAIVGLDTEVLWPERWWNSS
jgi:hypothetical protein